ncbi:MAG: response regulator [Chloroflexota bacterium]
MSSSSHFLRWGYRVLTAADGRQALAVYQAEGGAQLVITDVVMPEMGGKQLVQELMSAAPNLKVLGMTGYALKEVVDELKGAGFLELIQKPFEIDALARAVRRTLDAE